MISTSLSLKKFSQTITVIYDKASSMTHLLTSGANVFRRVFVQKDDIRTFRPNPNVCLRFCDQKKSSDYF